MNVPCVECHELTDIDAFLTNVGIVCHRCIEADRDAVEELQQEVA